MLKDLIPDCEEKLKDYIPYIGKRRVPYYCFGDYKERMGGLRCTSCSELEDCKNKDISKITWEPIIIRMSKDL